MSSDGIHVAGAAPVTAPVRMDHDLLAQLFTQEGRSLVRLASLFVDHRDAAEDVVQEAFLRLHRSPRLLRDPTKAAAYLRTVVLNVARDHNRRGLMSLRHHAAAGRELDVPDEIDAVDVAMARRAEDAALLDAVRSLPRRQRDCIVLRYYDQRSVDDIATMLGVSANSVKTHLKRAMRALGDHLGAS